MRVAANRCGAAPTGREQVGIRRGLCGPPKYDRGVEHAPDLFQTVIDPRAAWFSRSHCRIGVMLDGGQPPVAPRQPGGRGVGMTSFGKSPEADH